MSRLSRHVETELWVSNLVKSFKTSMPRLKLLLTMKFNYSTLAQRSWQNSQQKKQHFEKVCVCLDCVRQILIFLNLVNTSQDCWDFSIFVKISHNFLDTVPPKNYYLWPLLKSLKKYYHRHGQSAAHGPHAARQTCFATLESFFVCVHFYYYPGNLLIKLLLLTHFWKFILICDQSLSQ